MITPEDIIKKFNLKKHPAEGGYYIETYRSQDVFSDEKRGKRSVSTAIYYMLTPDTLSEIHRLCTDEVFHFYLGDPVEMLNLYPDGTGERLVLGADIENGMRPQYVVSAGVWQGSRLLPGGEFALLGATVAPGFDFADYQSGNREELILRYPQFKELIALLKV